MIGALLDRVLAAHGGNLKWFEFHSATARVKIEGAVWAGDLGAPAFADTEVAILTQEESLTMVSTTDPGLRSTFKPNLIQIETPGEDMVETRYNPKSSFVPGGRLADWDRFQTAYVCGYSIWNCLTQPFLFAFSGFEVQEMPPIVMGAERWRGIRVKYPSYIASPSGEVTCYVGDDGLMRCQDFEHHNLGGIAIRSVMSDYAEIQGLRLPVRRSLYLAEDLHRGSDAPLFASIAIDDIRFS